MESVCWDKLKQSGLSQRLMVGYTSTQGASLPAGLQQLLTAGLGGVIWFRHNAETVLNRGGSDSEARLQAVVDELQLLQSQQDTECAGPLLTGIDQEGGPVERFPWTDFPSIPSPYSLHIEPSLIEPSIQLLTQSLARLGFNLNFAPTIDVNTEAGNRVINVRSFGASASWVLSAALPSVETHTRSGVMPVIKHFPGHGSGVVDSHEALPYLNWNPDEQGLFQQLVEEGVPAVLVAHAHYPGLQPNEQWQGHGLPASLSGTLCNETLRQRWGFDGLLISDDLAMGAVTLFDDPVEVAIRCLNASVDLLLYRDCDEPLNTVLLGLLEAWEDGRIDKELHVESLARLQSQKAAWVAHHPPSFPSGWEALTRFHQESQAKSVSLHQRLFTEAVNACTLPPYWAGSSTPTRICLIHPAAEVLPHYQADISYGSSAASSLQEAAGLTCKPYHTDAEAEALLVESLGATSAQRVVFVSWLPRLGAEALSTLSEESLSNFLHVSIGWPVLESQEQPLPHTLIMPNWRPTSQHALVHWLQGA